MLCRLSTMLLICSTGLLMISCQKDAYEASADTTTSISHFDKMFVESIPELSGYTPRTIEVGVQAYEALGNTQIAEQLPPETYPLISATQIVPIEGAPNFVIPVLERNQFKIDDFITIDIATGESRLLSTVAPAQLGLRDHFVGSILQMSDRRFDETELADIEIEFKEIDQKDPNAKGCDFMAVIINTCTDYWIRSPDWAYIAYDYTSCTSTLAWYQECYYDDDLMEDLEIYWYNGNTGGSVGNNVDVPRATQAGVGYEPTTLCLGAADDLFYSGTSLFNDFEVRLNHFTYEFMVYMPDGSILYPTIDFNNIKVEVDDVFAYTESIYGDRVSDAIRNVFIEALYAVEGNLQAEPNLGGQYMDSLEEVELYATNAFQSAMSSILNQEPLFANSASRKVTFRTSIDPAANNTTWDDDCSY